ncbi:MAG: response regulator [Candidatus Obscuribacterales bacterium]|nr:response regulator [Candidatus Obscuribacterales bacterium]
MEVAASALEGLEKAKRTNPDLILSDIRMPGVDGTEFLQLLRDDPTTSQIPVIFMTASVQKEQIAGYQKLQIAGILWKPFDPMTLATEIEKLYAAYKDKTTNISAPD